MKEILFVVILVVCFFVPPIIFQQWWLLSVFVAFFTCFGIIEWVAVAKTGKSVSQKVWQMPMWKRIILCVCMAIAWGALLWHFLGHS